MASYVDLSADIIDVRDIIARVEELEQEREAWTGAEDDSWGAENPDDITELERLEGILSNLKGSGGDEQWRGDWYPVTLIRDDHFEDYAQQLAEETCEMGKAEGWPFRHIDWTAAAKELEQDYSNVDIDGTDYLFR